MSPLWLDMVMPLVECEGRRTHELWTWKREISSWNQPVALENANDVKTFLHTISAFVLQIFFRTIVEMLETRH